jgi:CheY-like chemotaxis protein
MERKVILLVEDNVSDAELIERALQKSGLQYTVFRARDGLDALNYLFGTGQQTSDRDLPVVVLLDLNLPRMDGLDLLRRMRSDYRTKLIPVAIFTGSTDEQDLINGYSLGANSYVRKPTDPQEFSLTVERLVTYWVMLNEPPPPGERIWAHHFDPHKRGIA